jgi:DNA replicative helicase MCM subunit Mcm2 (Cdc46/Mcm family)
MSKMQIKLLTGRSGPDGSHMPGEKIEVGLREAITLIQSNQAEPMNKAAYEKALKAIEDENLKTAEREAEINAIMHKETLELELRDLYAQVALKTAEIEGVILTDEEVKAFVAVSLEGEKFKGKEPK